MVTQTAATFGLGEAPDYGDILNCMHCGLCQPTCPTFTLTGRERSSPRGRIQLMRGVADGKLELSDLFGHEMYFCLGCLACQTACPAGVHYGRMLESARSQLEAARFDGRQSLWRKLDKLVRGAVRRVPFLAFEDLRLFRAAGKLLWFYHASGLRGWLHESGLMAWLRRLPRVGQLIEMEQLLPNVAREAGSEVLPEVSPALGEQRARVGVLLGCAMDVFCSPETRATVRVLQRNGCEVVAPHAAGCCGALHAHAGDMPRARELAKAVIVAFEEAGVEALVLNSAGCGKAIRDYPHWFEHDPRWHARAEALAAKTCDLTVWLDRVGLERRGLQPLGKVVTYHDACHLHHGQGVVGEPRRVLAQLPGARYVELTEANWCCGSAGIYNVTHFAESVEVLDRKMSHIAATGADVVITGNPGCLLQLRYGIARHGLPMEAWHTVELLDRAYGGE